MRKAFTLSEALIVLGVISVLAVISTNAIMDVKPDKNVIMFRKAYKTLRIAVDKLLQDSPCEINTNDVLAKELSICKNAFMYRNGEYRAVAALDDLINILSIKSGPGTCVKDMSKYDFTNNVAGVCKSFTTFDGIYWEVSTLFGFAWHVNIYPEGRNTCSSACYYSDTCKNPNAFFVIVNVSGEISNFDNAGCTYLRYPRINKVSKFKNYCSK
ncbi:hypothetical protein IJG72_02355 [bacterium]|nr:hypothetical protein [bacterium]